MPEAPTDWSVMLCYVGADRTLAQRLSWDLQRALGDVVGVAAVEVDSAQEPAIAESVSRSRTDSTARVIVFVLSRAAIESPAVQALYASATVRDLVIHGKVVVMAERSSPLSVVPATEHRVSYSQTEAYPHVLDELLAALNAATRGRLASQEAEERTITRLFAGVSMRKLAEMLARDHHGTGRLKSSRERQVTAARARISASTPRSSATTLWPVHSEVEAECQDVTKALLLNMPRAGMSVSNAAGGDLGWEMVEAIVAAQLRTA